LGLGPFLGVFYHRLGGLAAASFYIPYRGVKHLAEDPKYATVCAELSTLTRKHAANLGKT